MMTEAGKRLLEFLDRQQREDTESHAWRSGVLYAIECIENSLPTIEAEAAEQERARLARLGAEKTTPEKQAAALRKWNPDIAAVVDADALLAEVDRLRKENRELNEGLVWTGDTAARNARANERARIRAAVEGLTVRTYPDVWSEPFVDRAAVLAAIDGEAT